MNNKRHVDKLLSVFDLTIGEALSLTETISIRVMFIYDREEKIRKFVILNDKIRKQTSDKLALWLEENVDVYHVAHGLESNILNGDSLPNSLQIKQ
ncbi:MAG: hypothetical protein PVH82_09920 [Desulfobacteraceae bacterium]|jgi:hypothetical protein